MSSRTSSRSTFTMVPSTMSPSLKYLMVASIAARNSSSEPRSSMAILLALEVASMLLVMWAVAPVGWMSQYLTRGPASGQQTAMTPRSGDQVKIAELSADRGSAPYRDAQPTSASDSLP